jgi:hypothetical protein
MRRSRFLESRFSVAVGIISSVSLFSSGGNVIATNKVSIETSD